MKKYFKLILFCLGSAITVFAYYKAASAENKNCPKKSYTSKEYVTQTPSETSNPIRSDLKNDKDISNSKNSSAGTASENNNISLHDAKPHKETSENKNNYSDKNVTKDKPLNNQEQKPKRTVTPQNNYDSPHNTYENHIPPSNDNKESVGEQPVALPTENNSNDQEKGHENEGFSFIKSNEKVRNFIGDGHILLYVGIILIIVSILGIILTFVPRKVKKKKSRKK